MWDERYRTDTYVYGTEPNDFLRAMYPRIPPGRVLSLAEGEGRNAVFLAGQGYDVTAVDASAVGLEKARRLASLRGVRVACLRADLADFRIEPLRWRGVISIFCHLDPATRARLHQACVAGLQPGGLFLLEAYSPRQPAFGTGGPSSPELLAELSTLMGELRGLDFEHAEEVVRPVVEGTLHTGPAAVIQILARRPLSPAG